MLAKIFEIFYNFDVIYSCLLSLCFLLNQKMGTTFDGFTSVFLVEKKNDQKCDISRKKLKNIETQKMVLKRL